MALSVCAQHTEGTTNEWNDKSVFEQHKLYPRANVFSYSNEDAIEKWQYDHSANYILLSGEWRIDVQNDYHDRSSEFEAKGFSALNWDVTTLPSHPWMVSGRPATRPTLSNVLNIPTSGNSSASYYREFEVPKDWKNYEIFLQFQAASAYYIWVNQEYVGYSEDSRALSEFNLTKHLKFGKTNNIIIQVISASDGSLLEMNYDPKHNGITSDIVLHLKKPANLQDYKIVGDFDPVSNTGTFNIDVNVANRDKKGRYYIEVELWDLQGHQLEKLGKWIFFDKREELKVSLSREMGIVSPWSAETPNLYTAIVRLLNEEMQLQEVVGTRFGFRTIEVKEGQLVLNGKPIKLRGTSYADQSASKEEMRAALTSMKCNNINAVRTIAYSPANPIFYELCDELGLYVVCDANIQPFSSHNKAIATDGDYSNLFVARVQNLYESLKNHSSIIAWSLGESLDNGTCMANAYQEFKHKDATRPTIFAGAGYGNNSDIIATLGATPEYIQQYNSKSQTRPLLFLSYGSSKGNSFGSLEPFWDNVRNNSALCGGFASCWNSHTVYNTENAQTIQLPGLNGNPYLDELREIYRPFDVRLENISPDAAEFTISNLNDFLSLSDYRVSYTLYSNLKPHIIEGEVGMALLPHESKKFKLKIPKLMLYSGEELFIRFSVRKRNSDKTIDKQTTLSNTTFSIPMKWVEKQAIPSYERQPISILEQHTDDTLQSLSAIQLEGTDFSISFDMQRGVLSSYQYKGQEMITESPELNFWRNPTDNDVADRNIAGLWQQVNPKNIHHELVAVNYRKLDNYTVAIDVMTRYSTSNETTIFDLKQNYTILHSGDILIDNEMLVGENVKSLPRIGMRMAVSKALDTVEWFGADRESYCDRRTGVLIGHFEQPAAKLFYDYGGQQANGNHVDTRWCAIKNANTGLYVDLIDSLFEFSVMPQDEGFVLFADLHQAGVGCALAGIAANANRRLSDHHYHFRLHLRGYDTEENNAYDFSQVAYPESRTSLIEPPVISSNSEHFDKPISISIALPASAMGNKQMTIRYTLDGSTPTQSSPLYKEPFVIENSTLVKARIFQEGEAPSFVASQRFNYDYIVNASFVHKPNTPYNYNYQKTLFDDEEGDLNDLNRGWVGFSGNNLDVTFTLSKAVDIEDIQMHFAHIPEAWIFAPETVSVAVSTDGTHYTTPIEASLEYDATDKKMDAAQKVTISVPIDAQQVKSIRVLATNIGRLPQWHKARGLRAWLLSDEIIINEKIAH